MKARDSGVGTRGQVRPVVFLAGAGHRLWKWAAPPWAALEPPICRRPIRTAGRDRHKQQRSPGRTLTPNPERILVKIPRYWSVERDRPRPARSPGQASQTPGQALFGEPPHRRGNRRWLPRRCRSPSVCDSEAETDRPWSRSTISHRRHGIAGQQPQHQTHRQALPGKQAAARHTPVASDLAEPSDHMFDFSKRPGI